MFLVTPTGHLNPGLGFSQSATSRPHSVRLRVHLPGRCKRSREETERDRFHSNRIRLSVRKQSPTGSPALWASVDQAVEETKEEANEGLADRRGDKVKKD